MQALMKADRVQPRDGWLLPSTATATRTAPVPNWQLACPIIEPQIGRNGVHLWPFNPALPIDVNFFLRDRAADIQMNCHDYCEITFIYSGEAVYRIEQRSVLAREGDLVVIGSGVRHHVTELPSRMAKTVALYFLPELIGGGSGATGGDLEYLTPFLIQDNRFPHVVPARFVMSEDLFSLVMRIVKEASSEMPASRLCLRTYLKMILALLVKYYSGHPDSAGSMSSGQQDVRRLQPLFNYLEEHYSERITVGRAASLVSMSEPHFMRFFKRVTRHSFVSYLSRYRIAKAESLLASTDRSIVEISEEVGFYDQSHFGMVFRKFMNTTPRQYRLQAAERESATSAEKPAEIVPR